MTAMHHTELDGLTNDDVEQDVDLTVPDAPSPDDTGSGLAALAAELGRHIDQPKLFPVPDRDGWALECRVNLSARESAHYAKLAKKDIGLYNRLTIAATCIGLFQDGKRVVDDAGDPVTFTSKELLDLTGAKSAVAALHVFLNNNDGRAAQLSASIARASGYTSEEIDPDEVRAGDPQGSGD